MEKAAKIRLVRCPRCEKLLPESEDYSVFQCGGCGATLWAKRNKGESRRETQQETIMAIQSGCHPPRSDPATKEAKDSAGAAAMGGDAALDSDCYDVFLNFRGVDTRLVFVDFLSHSLADAGIRVFIDEEELPIGEEIGQELLRGIDRANIYIPIFSKNYAASRWCLLELAAMLESKAKSGGGKTIIPIFYDVEPSDVRLTTPLYRDALLEHKKMYSSEEVRAWEDALASVGSLRGLDTRSIRPYHIVREVTRIVVKLKEDARHGRRYYLRSPVMEIHSRDF